MRTQWGVHPVLEAALSYLDEDDVPREIEDALPPRRRLSIPALLELCSLCLDHLRPRVPRSQQKQFDRLSGLVARQLASRSESAHRESWQDELHFARRDFEHGRGALKVAALAAEVASADVFRHAPGVGPEAVALATDAVGRTAKLLAKDTPALLSFVRGLCERIAILHSKER